MTEDFHPDIIIGSVVLQSRETAGGDIIGQLESMIMQKTDYSVPDSTGILMTFKYDDVNLMDFNRFDELHDIGYKRTMELMDSIREPDIAPYGLSLAGEGTHGIQKENA